MPVEARRTAPPHNINTINRANPLSHAHKEQWGEASLVAQSINICKTKGLLFTTLQPVMWSYACLPSGSTWKSFIHILLGVGALLSSYSKALYFHGLALRSLKHGCVYLYEDSWEVTIPMCIAPLPHFALDIFLIPRNMTQLSCYRYNPDTCMKLTSQVTEMQDSSSRAGF